MDAQELYLSGGERAEAWMCGNCRTVHEEERLAASCCLGECWDCGAEVERGQMRCRRCWCKWHLKRDAANFRYAEKTAAERWSGPVFVPALGELYFGSLAEAQAAIAEAGLTLEDVPYVWGAETVPAVRLGFDELLESAGAYEEPNGDGWDLAGTDELLAAVEAFNRANEHLVSYDTDCQRAVVLKAGYGDEEEDGSCGAHRCAAEEGNCGRVMAVFAEGGHECGHR